MRVQEIERQILQETTHFNKKTFSDWIWEAAQSPYVPPTTREGKQFMNFLSETEKESPVIGFTAIYQQLETETQKLHFRESIGDNLLKHGNEEDAPAGALEDLIYLIGTTNAVESLNALLPTVGNGLLGKRNPDYLYHTIAALKSLKPSPQIQETMSQLTDSSNFDDGYLFEAIGIMSKCVPHKTFEFLLRFQLRLTKLRQDIIGLGSDVEWSAYKDCEDDLIETIQLLNPTYEPKTIEELL